ncbi:MAG TPA: type II toxin-antitoxin system RelE/ParE family toxin [Allosphingosinicella sp.]|nr:type II toxin-antitoxin system RelE/ParE family toxin [Allosphingosinicella sp.]
MEQARFDVALTQGTEDDLEAIYDYLAQNRSIDDAEAFLEVFLEKIDTVERLPLRGDIPKELDTLGIREFRQVLLRPYRLMYRVAASKVFVLVIADGRRDMQALLERRLLGGR